MRKTGFGRIAPILAVIGWAGACADQPSPLGPVGAVASPLANVGAAGEGDLIVCKTGNDVGTFTFNYSFTPDPSTNPPPVGGGSVNVDVGNCATIVTAIGGRYTATIVEQAPPLNWALGSITVSLTGPVGGGYTTDVPTRTTTVRVSNDQGATVTYDNVFTPPPGGCTFTQGYWKTHSEFGPAPYNSTWAKLPNGASTTFYLSGQTWYQVFHTPPAGNAYYNLAHQYMAAHLNTLWGASVPAGVATAMATSNSLFNTYTPAQIAALSGNNALRKQFIALAGTLDAYNNGITGPGHCGS